MTKGVQASGWWPTRRSVAAALAAFAVAPGRNARADAAPGVSEWSVSDHARVRLIDAGPGDAKARLAGIQIELDPGYLTYWRSPGEAGLPPTVTFAGSMGMKFATLLFPAPGRYSEGGTQAIGYKDDVIFPVLVKPDDAAKPVALRMAMDFAICERLCLPAKAGAMLSLDGDGKSPEAALVREALARVPVQTQVGQDGALAITAVEGTAADSALVVRAQSRGTDVPLLFAEAPDPWFIEAGEGLWSNDGTLRYVLTVVGKPAEPAPLPLRLTLVSADAAIEAAVTLDAPQPKP